ncbi:MAG: class III signal peptide-containing protein [Candidatus Bilamarchaeaceae archaeon]
MKGQLSAEMLILITVVLAIVAIAATQLMSTAKETATNINSTTQTLAQKTQLCNVDSDCTCSSGIPKCNLGVCTCS